MISLRYNKGFTLIEILVVIAIISILASVIIANVSRGSAQSRDTERKADLTSIQSALELYKLRNGRYPEGCRGPGVWSGQVGTSFACPAGTPQYIVGLAPEFIRVLPIDPKLNGVNSGYVYTTNAQGSVYKIMAKNSVEGETVTYVSQFKSCDVDATASTVPLCNLTHPSNTTPNHCQLANASFQTTFALWGGFVDNENPILVERFTEDIVCDIP